MGHSERTDDGRSNRWAFCYAVLSALWDFEEGTEEPLEVATGDAYLQHRLRLVKNGQPVHYRKGVIQLLRAKDESGSNLGGPRFVTVLEPNQQTELDSINLERWFEKLEPGHYELTLRHRFQWKGKQVESNTVTFEVTQ